MKTRNLRALSVIIAFGLIIFTAGSIAAQKTEDELFELGNDQYTNKKDDAAAIQAYTQCIGVNPSSSKCYFNRGLALYRVKDFDGSIKDYDQVIKMDPTNSKAFIRRGLAHYQKKNYTATIADYETALKMEPANAPLKNALDKTKELVASTEQLEQAKKKYQAALDRQNSLSEGFLKTANQQLAKRDIDNAIMSYTLCILGTPKKTACLTGRSTAYSEKKDYASAVIDLTALIAVMPEADNYYKRGLAYNLKGDRVLATADYQKAVQLNPDHVKAKLMLKTLGVRP